MAGTSDALRFWAFWLVCLPVRLGIAVLLGVARRRGPPGVVYTAAAYALYTGLSLFWQALVLRPTHGGFGGKVWWGRPRWIHASLWTAAGVLLLVPEVPWWSATALLVVDVLVGAEAGACHHGLRYARALRDGGGARPAGSSSSDA